MHLFSSFTLEVPFRSRQRKKDRKRARSVVVVCEKRVHLFWGLFASSPLHLPVGPRAPSPPLVLARAPWPARTATHHDDFSIEKKLGLITVGGTESRTSLWKKKMQVSPKLASRGAERERENENCAVSYRNFGRETVNYFSVADRVNRYWDVYKQKSRQIISCSFVPRYTNWTILDVNNRRCYLFCARVCVRLEWDGIVSGFVKVYLYDFWLSFVAGDNLNLNLIPICNNSKS